MRVVIKHLHLSTRRSVMSRNCNKKGLDRRGSLPACNQSGGGTSIWAYRYIFRWNLVILYGFQKNNSKYVLCILWQHTQQIFIISTLLRHSFYIFTTPPPSCGCYPFLPAERFSPPAAGTPAHPPDLNSRRSVGGRPWVFQRTTNTSWRGQVDPLVLVAYNADFACKVTRVTNFRCAKLNLYCKYS